VANNHSDNVSVIDGETNTVTATVPVGHKPIGVAVNPGTNRIYVANNHSDNVSVIDGETDTVTATVPAGDGPFSVAVNAITNRIYVANGTSDDLSVIDGETNTVTATIPVEDWPYGVALNSDTNRIYVVNTVGSVSVIDGATDTLVATVTLFEFYGQGPYSREVGINPTTNRIYVANGSPACNVSVIDGETNTVAATVSLNGHPSEPTGVAVNPAANRIYVTNYANDRFYVLDGATNTVIATVALGVGERVGPISVAANPNTNLIYVTNHLEDAVAVIEDTSTPDTPTPDTEICDDGTDNDMDGDVDCDDPDCVGRPDDGIDKDKDDIADACELNGWDTGAMELTDPSTGKKYTISQLVDWDPFSDDIDGDGDNDVEDSEFHGYLCPTMVRTDPQDEDTDHDGISDHEDPFPTSAVNKYEIAVKGLGSVGPMAVPCDLETMVKRWYSYYSTGEPTPGCPECPGWIDGGGDGDGDTIPIGPEQCIGTVYVAGIADPQHGTPYLSRYDFDCDGASDYWEIVVQGSDPFDPPPVLSDDPAVCAPSDSDDAPTSKTLLFAKADIPFSYGGIDIGPGDVGPIVWLDLADFLGETEDGNPENHTQWVTVWIGLHFGAGLTTPYLDMPVDVGTHPLTVPDIDADPWLDPGLAVQVLFWDTSGGIHFLDFLKVGATATVSPVRFDLRKDKLIEMLLETGAEVGIPVLPELLAAQDALEWFYWLFCNTYEDDTSEWECPEPWKEPPDYIRDAELSGAAEATAILLSPADLVLADPEGLVISKDSSEIPGASYMEYDVNGDGDPDDVVSVPERKMGDYRITVVPEPAAAPTDTYMVLFWADSTSVVLAENVAISDIPNEPYVIQSTASGILLEESTETTTSDSDGRNYIVLVGIVGGAAAAVVIFAAGAWYARRRWLG